MQSPPSLYSAKFLISIERTVTNERLTRYLTATAQDLSRALQLYEYNVHLSEVLYGLLHGLEVTVRNAADYDLAASYGAADWYDRAPLSSYWMDRIARAKNGVGATTPGKVVAELTFGFWVELLSKRNQNILWVGRRLKTAFPNTTLSREIIHERLKAIQRLRNRIAHHERVLTSSKKLYAGHDSITLPELVECADWVCSDTAQWMRTQFRYGEAERILSGVSAMGLFL
jgi:hypothetical protein